MRTKRFRKTIFACMVATILVLGLSTGAFVQEAYDEDLDECTTVIAVGLATHDGNTRTGQTSDGIARATGLTPTRVVSITVDEKTGIRSIGGALNDQGVTAQHNGRRPLPGMRGRSDTWADANEAYIVEYAYVVADHPDAVRSSSRKALAAAHTAKEAVDIYVAGLPEGSYYILGPFRNEAYGHANAYIEPELWPSQRDSTYSRNRGERAHELLQERNSWRNATESSVWGEISSLYLFGILRTHDTPWGFNSTWTFYYEESGNICRWGHDAISSIGTVSEVNAEYPDLLSIYWCAPAFPAFCPFIPFFMGLDEIPPAFADGEKNESDIFRELFSAVSYKMDYADGVQKFWESFDHQTVSELMFFYRDVEELLDDGDMEGAKQLLYNFSNAKSELAISYAKELVKLIVEGRPISDMRIDTSLPNRPTWK